MKATQVEIAREVGLDVSSVNKILNRKPGPVFRKETIKRVFKVAKQLGYDFSKASKGNILAALQELFPNDATSDDLAARRGIEIERVIEIRKLIARASGAAIVLLTLRVVIGL